MSFKYSLMMVHYFLAPPTVVMVAAFGYRRNRGTRKLLMEVYAIPTRNLLREMLAATSFIDQKADPIFIRHQVADRVALSK